MNVLTQPIAIRGVELSGRLVMPPMASGKPNPDGTVSDSLVEYYKEKSQGGYLGPGDYRARLCVPAGQGPRRPALHRPGGGHSRLRRLADAIHNNGVKAVAQISHAGGAAIPRTQAWSR